MVSRRDARCLAALSGALLLAYGAAAIAQTSNEPTDTERFDCQQLAEWERPDSPLEWFERSLWAGHCHVFQARAVRIGIDGVRTLALSRDIQDGIEREVARFLDGPDRKSVV